MFVILIVDNKLLIVVGIKYIVNVMSIVIGKIKCR